VPDALFEAIRSLANGQSLSADEATGAFDEIMQGNATPVRVAAILVALRVKGETAGEIAGVAQSLRRAMRRIEVPAPETLVDTCGTGGGAVGTFNVSTAAAFVAAGAGVRIAKHGNRSFTSRCGSADVLEALGVNIELPVERLAGVLEQAGIVFMFAPTMHPAMRHVGPVRRDLSVPTVMNIVGPLANPAGASRQVVGVADRSRVQLIANALLQLGTTHALVVHGELGLDEISPLGSTVVLEVKDGAVREWMFDARDFGFGEGQSGDLAGAEPAANAVLIEEILRGRGPRAARDAVVLNAGAAVYVSGRVADLAAGVAAATESIASGRAFSALEKLRTATQP
jgi:anthranilate phosphoribosyltransferase